MLSFRRLLDYLGNLVGTGQHTRFRGDNRTDIVLRTRGGEQLFARRAEPYGLASKPAASPAVFISVNGDRSNNIAINVRGSGNAPPLKIGEVAVWNSAGAYIHLRDNGTINIVGNVTVNGTIAATGDITAGTVSLQQHTHPQNNGSHYGGGVDTSPPNA